MTAYRVPGTVEAALARVLPFLSDREIREATGKSLELFRKVSNPNCNVRLSLEDGACLDALLESKGYQPELGPLFQEMRNDALRRLGGCKPRSVCIHSALNRTVVEMGDLARAVDDGMADNILTPHERRTIATEAQQVMDAARVIRDHAEPPQNVVAFNGAAAE